MRAEEFIWLAEKNTQECGWVLKSPAVGYFTNAPAKGKFLEAGAVIGAVMILGKSHSLRLPQDVGGVVTSSPPEQAQHPVEFGEVVFTLRSQSQANTLPVKDDQKEEVENLLLRSPQVGRFYRSASPETPPYVEVGQEIAPGKTIGLLEVMKTFTPVKWQGFEDSVYTAKLTQFLVDDGADVEEGQAIAQLEAVENPK